MNASSRRDRSPPSTGAAGKSENDPPENTTGSSGLRTQALHDEVTRVARELWNRYGRPEGRDEAIRQEAERQVLGADPEIARVPDGPVSAAGLREANSAALGKNQGDHKPKPAPNDS